MSCRKMICMMILLLPVFGGILPASADIYRYVDAEGRIHFTDTPTHGRWNMYLKEKPAADAGRMFAPADFARPVKLTAGKKRHALVTLAG